MIRIERASCMCCGIIRAQVVAGYAAKSTLNICKFYRFRPWSFRFIRPGLLSAQFLSNCTGLSRSIGGRRFSSRLLLKSGVVLRSWWL